MTTAAHTGNALSLAMLLVAGSCASPPTVDPAPDWHVLFDGTAAHSFEATDFAFPGDVELVDGTLRLGWGDPLTGVHWAGSKGWIQQLRTRSYELEVEVARLDGADFFCGLTYPVGNEHVTLILGGWGGSLVGLSCLDGADASENETQSFQSFVDRRFYKVRVAVLYEPTGPVLSAWIDDRRVVHVDARDREVGLRFEVESSRPLGIASYMTETAVRLIRIRVADAIGQFSSSDPSPGT